MNTLLVKPRLLRSQLVAQDLGLPGDTEITKEVLDDVRRQAGKAYEKVKALREPITADDLFADERVRIFNEVGGSDAPDWALELPFMHLVGSIPREMSAKAWVQTARAFRKLADEAGATGIRESAKLHQDFANQIDAMLERTVPDSQLVQEMRAARSLIARTYDVEKALDAPGVVNAQKLGTLLKKRPLTGGLRQAAEFAQGNRKFAQPTSSFGAASGNVLTDLVAGGVVGGAREACLHVGFPCLLRALQIHRLL